MADFYPSQSPNESQDELYIRQQRENLFTQQSQRMGDLASMFGVGQSQPSIYLQQTDNNYLSQAVNRHVMEANRRNLELYQQLNDMRSNATGGAMNFSDRVSTMRETNERLAIMRQRDSEASSNIPGRMLGGLGAFGEGYMLTMGMPLLHMGYLADRIAGGAIHRSMGIRDKDYYGSSSMLGVMASASGLIKDRSRETDVREMFQTYRSLMGYNPAAPFNRGLTPGQSQDVYRHIRSISDRNVGEDEIIGITERMLSRGDIRTTNLDKIKDIITEKTSQLKSIASVLNSTLDEADRAAKEIENSFGPGINPVSFSTAMRARGTISGFGTTAMLQAAGSGRDIFFQGGRGLGMAQGADVGSHVMASLGYLQSTGRLDQRDINMIGGFPTAANNISGALAAYMTNPRGGGMRLLAAATERGPGGMMVNQDIIGKYISGSLSDDDISRMANIKGRNDDFRLDFFYNRDKLAGQLSPSQVMGMMESRIRNRASRVYGTGSPTEDQMAAQAYTMGFSDLQTSQALARVLSSRRSVDAEAGMMSREQLFSAIKTQEEQMMNRARGGDYSIFGSRTADSAMSGLFLGLMAAPFTGGGLPAMVGLPLLSGLAGGAHAAAREGLGFNEPEHRARMRENLGLGSTPGYSAAPEMGSIVRSALRQIRNGLDERATNATTARDRFFSPFQGLRRFGMSLFRGGREKLAAEDMSALTPELMQSIVSTRGFSDSVVRDEQMYIKSLSDSMSLGTAGSAKFRQEMSNYEAMYRNPSNARRGAILEGMFGANPSGTITSPFFSPSIGGVAPTATIPSEARSRMRELMLSPSFGVGQLDEMRSIMRDFVGEDIWRGGLNSTMDFAANAGQTINQIRRRYSGPGRELPDVNFLGMIEGMKRQENLIGKIMGNQGPTNILSAKERLRKASVRLSKPEAFGDVGLRISGAITDSSGGLVGGEVAGEVLSVISDLSNLKPGTDLSSAEVESLIAKGTKSIFRTGKYTKESLARQDFEVLAKEILHGTANKKGAINELLGAGFGVAKSKFYESVANLSDTIMAVDKGSTISAIDNAVAAASKGMTPEQMANEAKNAEYAKNVLGILSDSTLSKTEKAQEMISGMIAASQKLPELRESVAWRTIAGNNTFLGNVLEGMRDHLDKESKHWEKNLSEDTKKAKTRAAAMSYLNQVTGGQAGFLDEKSSIALHGNRDLAEQLINAAKLIESAGKSIIKATEEKGKEDDKLPDPRL